MNRQTIAKIAALVITIALVAILLSQIKIADVITTLAGIDPLYLVAGFVLYVCSNFFRALRFHILLNGEVRIKDLFNIVCAHNMVNNILPARTGELSYIYLLKKLHNKTTGEGIATLFVARVFDFIAISLLFFISALMIQDLPEIIMKAIWMIALLMVLSVIFLITLLYFGESFLNLVRRFFGRFSWDKKCFADYLLRKGGETVEGFDGLRLHKLILPILSSSLLIWCFLYSVAYVLIVMGMEIYLSIPKIIVGATLVMLTMILPIQGLSGFGTSEGAWTIVMIPLGLSKELAIISGFCSHIIQTIYLLILGILGLLLVTYGIGAEKLKMENKKVCEKEAFRFYNTNRTYFEKAEDDFNFRPLYKMLAEGVHRVVLDVGAGSGWINRHLKQNKEVKKIIACDISRLGLSTNDANGRIQCLADALPLKDNSVDCSISVNAFEHFPNPKKVVMEMVRVTKDTIIVTSPNFANPFLPSESLRCKSLSTRVSIFLKKLFGISPIFITPDYNNYKSDSDVCYEVKAKDLEKWFEECGCDVSIYTKHERPELIYRLLLRIFDVKIFKPWGPIIFLIAKKR